MNGFFHIAILGGKTTIALDEFEDFVIYTTPEVMAEKCDFIYGWKKERLYELCDLEGKIALDVVFVIVLLAASAVAGYPGILASQCISDLLGALIAAGIFVRFQSLTRP